MATVDNSVRNSLSSLNALAGKISPQSNNIDNGNKSNCVDTNGTSDENGGKLNGRVMNHREPDPDSIKMFVGQVPRSMDENDLRKMFEEFGEVYQINVLRDKVTGQSKGCCFVTFYTRKAALEAQNALHNIKTLASMHHPIQMKPADTENRNGISERKLFIGMLTKRFNEQEVRTMFSQYGNIEECTVLRDSNGQSKGCAFVTYSSRQCAINAIKKMHHSQTMEGCSSPVVVKFADTQKEKDAKRFQQNLWNVASTTGSLTTLGPQYLALLQQQVGNTSTGAAGGLGGLVGSLPQLSSINNLSVQQLLAASQGNLAPQIFDSPKQLMMNFDLGIGSLGSLSGLNLPTSTNGSQESSLQSILASMASQNTGLGMNVQNLATLAAMTSGNTSGLQAALSQPVSVYHDSHKDSMPFNVVNGIMRIGPYEYSPHKRNLPDNLLAGMTASTGGFGSALTPSLSSASSSGSTTTGKQIEGPEGANLFIYHLPQEFSDQELAQTFWPFGKVISAKVFIDKQTNLSKCFGFVSYDNAHDAQRAIQHMNGQQIGNKRLKVQLKRSKNDCKPY